MLILVTGFTKWITTLIAEYCSEDFVTRNADRSPNFYIQIEMPISSFFYDHITLTYLKTLLMEIFPKKTEHDLRSELTAFGLSPKQANTNVRFLSGGERCRLSMATMMLRDPQLLVIDEITNHLDAESVEALIYGINQWKGTLVMASHDTNFIRQITGGECFVLMGGHLRRIDGGIDAYLKSFKSH